MNRPWWCQDPTCQTVNRTPHADDPNAYALSGFCAGLLAAPLRTERHGYVHVNDAHLCFRSAVRGVVMLEVNEVDLQNVCRAAMHTMVAMDPAVQFSGRWYTGRDAGWEPPR